MEVSTPHPEYRCVSGPRGQATREILYAAMALSAAMRVASFALSRTCFLAARNAAPEAAGSTAADLRSRVLGRLVIRTPHSSQPAIRFASAVISARPGDRVASTARFSVENMVNSFIGTTVHPR